MRRTDFCSFPPSPDSPSPSKMKFKSGISRLLIFFSNQSSRRTRGTSGTSGTPDVMIGSLAVRLPPMVDSLHIRTPLEKSVFGRSLALATCPTNGSDSIPPTSPQVRDCLQMANQSSHSSILKFIDGTQKIKTSLPSVSTEDSGHNKFTLGFSVDEKFAVFGLRKEKTVTIIDLQSGEPRWIANVGVGIDCLEMAGSTVVLVGEEKIVTWNLPGGDSSFNASIDDSVRTTVLHHSSKRHGSGTPTYMSISPDLSRIIVARAPPQAAGYSLEVVNVSTGLCLASIETYNMMRPRFTQD